MPSLSICWVLLSFIDCIFRPTSLQGHIILPVSNSSVYQFSTAVQQITKSLSASNTHLLAHSYVSREWGRLNWILCSRSHKTNQGIDCDKVFSESSREDGEESTSKLIQVVAWIYFVVVVRL